MQALAHQANIYLWVRYASKNEYSPHKAMETAIGYNMIMGLHPCKLAEIKTHHRLQLTKSYIYIHTPTKKRTNVENY